MLPTEKRKAGMGEMRWDERERKIKKTFFITSGNYG
jgi:hypothetical protein